MGSEKGLTPPLMAATTSTCAALYAMGAYATSYITSPWGTGQFRPAVVIPVLFATIFGSIPAGLGAATGTLIADSIKHGQLYLPSLIAAVPGNFIGFYLFGNMLRKRFSWGAFVKASIITLVLANLIVAVLYVFVFYPIYMPQRFSLAPVISWLFVALGFTAWWFVTMLPFVLLVGPVLIRATASAFPAIVRDDVKTASLRSELPKRSLAVAMLVPGIVMIIVGLATTFTPLGFMMVQGFGKAAQAILAGIILMFYGSGIALLMLGFLTLGAGRIYRPTGER